MKNKQVGNVHSFVNTTLVRCTRHSGLCTVVLSSLIPMYFICEILKLRDVEIGVYNPSLQDDFPMRQHC